MTFLYPLGLLGLLGIPVLIIIYIISNDFTIFNLNNSIRIMFS